MAQKAFYSALFWSFDSWSDSLPQPRHLYFFLFLYLIRSIQVRLTRTKTERHCLQVKDIPTPIKSNYVDLYSKYFYVSEIELIDSLFIKISNNR